MAVDHPPIAEPWLILAEAVESGQPEAVQERLAEFGPMETALAVSRLSEDQRTALLTLISPAGAADMLSELPAEQAADLISALQADQAAAIVDLLPPDEQADLLADVGSDEAEAIMEAMPEADALQARRLLEYPMDTAGGLMTTDYLAFLDSATVGEVIEDLRRHRDRYSDFEVQYAYIHNPAGGLAGVLRMRDLLLAPPERPVAHLMIVKPLRVRVDTPLEDLIQIYEEHTYLGIPVVDGTGRLVGVVRRSAVKEAEGQRQKSLYLKISGIVGGEEFRSMPLLLRSFRRLSWLAPNIVLNLVAASIIALYQDTLQAAIALAVFLPIISDMSGCSGNQAVAVSIRELALGLIRPNEFLRVFIKEIGLGLMNGSILGLLLGSVAYLWKGNVVLGLVVGVALALNTVLSVLLGGAVPLALRRMGVDPALASGPVLTTVTDLCGFFFVLSFATFTLPLLQ
jgi:magnesium transporter